MSAKPWDPDPEAPGPLMVLPPRDRQSHRGPRSGAPGKAPALHRGAFGYDIRVDVAPPERSDRDGRAWRRFGLLTLIVVVLGATVTLCAAQPRVRFAIANLFAAPVPSPGQSHATPKATSDHPVSSATSTSISAAVAPLQSQAAPPPAPAGQTLTFSGSRLIRPDGSRWITCEAAEAQVDRCLWTLTVQPGHPLDLRLTWSEAAGLDLEILAPDGSRLQTASGSDHTLYARMASPPQSAGILVHVNSGSNVHFALMVADHPV